MSRGTDEGIVVKPAPGMGGGLSGIIGSRREKSDGPPDMAAMAAMAARGGGMGMNGSARGSGTPARPVCSQMLVFRQRFRVARCAHFASFSCEQVFGRSTDPWCAARSTLAEVAAAETLSVRAPVHESSGETAHRMRTSKSSA